MNTQIKVRKAKPIFLDGMQLYLEIIICDPSLNTETKLCGHFLILFFWLSANDIGMFLPKYVHFSGLKLNSAFEEFSITVCVLLHVNMLTKHNTVWSVHFFMMNILRLMSTSGSNLIF